LLNFTLYRWKIKLSLVVGRFGRFFESLEANICKHTQRLLIATREINKAAGCTCVEVLTGFDVSASLL
jgi:hypothetical protein